MEKGGYILDNRAAVFIDGAYLTKILDVDFGKPKIDLAKFSDMLCGNNERLRTYYYNCIMQFNLAIPLPVIHSKHHATIRFTTLPIVCLLIGPRFASYLRYESSYSYMVRQHLPLTFIIAGKSRLITKKEEV